MTDGTRSPLARSGFAKAMLRCNSRQTGTRLAPDWHQTGTRLAPASTLKTKKSAGANRLTMVFIGSPTWARTRDLRINRRSVGSGCRPRQCSLSGVRASNTFESVSSISTGLERRIDYWILERFPPRIPGRGGIDAAVPVRRLRPSRFQSPCLKPAVRVGPPDRRRSRTPGPARSGRWAR